MNKGSHLLYNKSNKIASVDKQNGEKVLFKHLFRSFSGEGGERTGRPTRTTSNIGITEKASLPSGVFGDCAIK